MKHWKIVAVKLIFERLLKQEIDGHAEYNNRLYMHAPQVLNYHTSSVKYAGAGVRGWSHLLVVVVSSR